MNNSTNNNINNNNQTNTGAAPEPVPLMKRASYGTPTSETNGGANSTSSSKRMSMRKSVLAHRREFLEQQAALDKQVFDSSLGCPLASFDHATLALVGGKALQCWRLAKHGFPVPTSFVVPTYVFSLHVGQAGVADMIQQLFNNNNAAEDYCWHNNPTAKAVAIETLTMIRTKILETPLHPKVVQNLEAFLATYLDPGTPVAVRSSGSAEDLANQSFAGQYETYLYQTSLDDICHSIKKCWASMFQPFILEYASRATAAASSGTNDQHFTATGGRCETRIRPPQMAVLIMKMVNAEQSGVCFTRNLWGADNEVMIEAVLGQGEGLVSGSLTPDRYVLNKYNNVLVYQDLHEQTHHFVRNIDGGEGVSKQALSEPHKGPVLSDIHLRSLTRLAKSVEDFYNHPQDIEWAIDSTGTVYLLQSRPITTINKHESLSFLPPGDGFWKFDPTHFPRPLSPWMQASYGFDYITERSRKTGCLIKSINIRFVHGFAFTQLEMGAPCDALERAADAFWKKKLFEDEYREFTDFFRPECEMLQDELRVVNPSALGHSSLVEHVIKCFDYAVEFWKRHHTYSIPTMVIVGDFMNSMSALTGKDIMETLVLLEGASPESRGIHNQQDLLLAKLYSLLRRSEQAQALLRSDEKAAPWALDCLLHMPNELGETMREATMTYGHTLAGGYDIVVPTLIESPHFFLKTLLQGVLEDEDKADVAEEQVNARIEEWRNALPTEKHAEFDEILSLGRKFFRMRDERGLATDLSGVGLCRRGILEGGRRLVEQGIINEAEHLTVATKCEAIALLTGNLGMLRGEADQQGPVDIPTAQVLQRRFNYIKTADPNLIPRELGPHPPPPPEGSLPPGMARTMAAIESGVLKGIWDEGSHTDEAVTKNPDLVKGVAASMGKVTGPVCLILQDDDLQKVKKGDIIVTYSSSASFNMVLGLCAGICTDYGGMLSHAAIVAREYGIPAIVGTQLATKKFKSGDVVCIDSSTSTVQRVD